MVCFSVQTFAGSLGRCLNTRPAALCSNTFLVIHRMFEHWKPWLIPIILFDFSKYLRWSQRAKRKMQSALCTKSSSCVINPRTIKKTGIKARLMTRTYVLQTVRAKFNQYTADPTCLLCCENPEDHEHFLLRCHFLLESRNQVIQTIDNVLSQYLRDDEQQGICCNS